PETDEDEGDGNPGRLTTGRTPPALAPPRLPASGGAMFRSRRSAVFPVNPRNDTPTPGEAPKRWKFHGFPREQAASTSHAPVEPYGARAPLFSHCENALLQCRHSFDSVRILTHIPRKTKTRTAEGSGDEGEDSPRGGSGSRMGGLRPGCSPPER